MLTRLCGAKVYDPANGGHATVRDLYFRDGVMTTPGRDERIDREIDGRGRLAMAGAIDLHTHIGGGKVNIARAMLPELQRLAAIDRTELTASGVGGFIPSTSAAGYRYVEMGFTACFEPAVLPSNARQAHMEMADTPIVDTGGYVMLGNDDFMLDLLARGADPALVRDYVAWTLRATQCIGIKVVNPGGINAFKFNARKLDVDERGPGYGVAPRDIVQSLSDALVALGVPHPLHVHCSNLGVPGNVDSTLATLDAAQGRPLHLTHVQFHSYGSEGELGFSSAARAIAEAVNANPAVSIDVGQVMFGQTVTVSGDTMRQHANRRLGRPRKWTGMDIECEAGCGVVPFRYREKRFVNALQWAIGLELFLLVEDPWRVFLTTDHPNGGPFTCYPHLIRLLMDRDYRNEALSRIDARARSMTVLAQIEREYTLEEIAIMTRAAPARSLGLDDLGHLGEGAVADIVLYDPDNDIERMFAEPEMVFRRGELVARNGEIVAHAQGRTHVVRPEYDGAVEGMLARHFQRHHTVRLGNFKIGDDEMAELIGSPVQVHPCHGARAR